MKYAIISDPHSNLEALRAVLAKIKTLGVDKSVCLGDIVGYNADPNECVELLRSSAISTVMGNHDSCAAGLKEPVGFNPAAKKAVLWTRSILTEENAEYLKSLPRSIRVAGDIMAVHGWVNDTDRYIFGPKDAAMNFSILKRAAAERAEMARGVCFFGHTHVPAAYMSEDERARELDREMMTIDTDGGLYLVNPGSVGQPRDRDPRASFLIYDTKDHSVSYHRVQYDIDKTMRKIINAGLPEMLAERLKRGG